jgi:hypothetical protein
MLYILTWAYMYPWFKWFFRRYFNYSYKWFYQNNRSISLRLFYNDLKLLLISLPEFVSSITKYYSLNTFENTNFFLLKSPNKIIGFTDFNKKFVYSSILNDMLYFNKYDIKTPNYFSFLFLKFKFVGSTSLEFFYNLF